MWVGAVGLLLLAEILKSREDLPRPPLGVRDQVAGAGLHCPALPGPQRPVAGKHAAPGPATGPTTLRTNWSWMESSTKSRPAAMQFSPLLKKTELIPCAEGRTALGYDPWGNPPPPAVLTICTALSRSQSAKMRRGDFPPSSRETFFTLLRALPAMNQNVTHKQPLPQGAPRKQSSPTNLSIPYICPPYTLDPLLLPGISRNPFAFLLRLRVSSSVPAKGVSPFNTTYLCFPIFSSPSHRHPSHTLPQPRSNFCYPVPHSHRTC